mmetsp:Transcript_20055/g.38530  ORF Transcript_20055/g.38530 Transcript_20055/m.38530 type:complete len:234 (-) Transcript_20055:1044-1745(-)
MVSFLTVTQPVLPSVMARTYTRLVELDFSSLGPSSSSIVSPSASTLMSLALSLWNTLCSGMEAETMYVRPVSSAYRLPALPLVVTQPSILSFGALALIRVTPAPSSWIGPSRTSNSSPLSNFRKTLQSLMFLSLVSAIPEMQVKVLFPCLAHSSPCLFLMVNQPVAPSNSTLPRARRALPRTSCRGPSRTSTTSPGLRERTSLQPWDAKPSCRATAAQATKHGLGRSWRKGVP